MIARSPGATPLQRIAPWVSTVVRLVLAGLFLAAGGLKVVDLESSVAAVRAYELLPASAATLVGWVLPFLQIALGLLLAAGAFPRVAAAAALLLLATFLAAVVSARVRGLSVDCGCFGGGGPVAGQPGDYSGEILRDALLLMLPMWLLWHPRSRLALEPGPRDLRADRP